MDVWKSRGCMEKSWITGEAIDRLRDHEWMERSWMDGHAVDGQSHG